MSKESSLVHKPEDRGEGWNVSVHLAAQTKLLEVEEAEDVEGTLSLLSQLQPSLLQKGGYAMLNLRISGIRSGLGGKTIVTLENGMLGQPLVHQAFRTGDIVQLKFSSASIASSKGLGKGGLEDSPITGTVFKATTTALDCVLRWEEAELPDILTHPNASIMLVKTVNTISYVRMHDALGNLKRLFETDQLRDVHQVLLGMKEPDYDEQFSGSCSSSANISRSIGNDLGSIQFYDPTLNAVQQKAVEFALSARHLALVHGPPGTGKTHTLIEIIRQLVLAKKERVLVCGPSNISVDNIVERLAGCKLNIVRVGHPARLLSTILEHSLDYQLSSSDEGILVRDVRKELDAAIAQRPRSKTDRRQKYEDIKFLRKELRQRESKVLSDILGRAQVVLSTLNGAASSAMRRGLANHTGSEPPFDTVIIDEATQALESECWIAILLGKRVILAGDHFQLPPTVKSITRSIGANGVKSKSQSLSYTLFDRLLDQYGDRIKAFLSIQYRMNSLIQNFSSKELYEGRLIPGPGVADRLLKVLPNIEDNEITRVPLMFIDTAGFDIFEQTESDLSPGNTASPMAMLLADSSKLNQGEADLVVKHVQSLIKSGLAVSEIAVLSPYNGQVALLRSLLHPSYPSLEIGSVDGMQGREKEAIILSLVRSNDQGEIGFLGESRRLNVGITRAKRHLCVVGDSECLGRKGGFLKRMMEYFEEYSEVTYPEVN